MKLHCNLSVILNRLILANDIVASKSTMGLFNSILIRAEKNHQVVIQSTDTKITFRTVFPAEVLEEGEVLVFCGRLMGILRTIQDGDILFQSSEANGLLHIEPLSGKKLKLELRTLHKERFPNMPEAGEEEYFELGQELFLDMVQNTSFSVSTDDTRYYLTGCFFEKNDESLSMVATDAKRLACFSVQDNEIPMFEGIIVPTKVLHFLSKVMSGEGNFKIAVSPKRIYFRVDDYSVSSVLIEGKFPDYTKILPKSSGARIILNREEFLDAVRRVSIMTEQSTKSFSLQIFADQRVLVSAKGNEDVAEEEIAIEADEVEETQFFLTSRHLLEPMKCMRTEKVCLEYTTVKDPVKLTGVGDDRFFHIFMAMSQEEN